MKTEIKKVYQVIEEYWANDDGYTDPGRKILKTFVGNKLKAEDSFCPSR